MSLLRSPLASAILAATVLAGASAQAAAPLAHPSPRHAPVAPESAKHAACERVWTAQKVRHGTRQAFVAACVAKG